MSVFPPGSKYGRRRTWPQDGSALYAYYLDDGSGHDTGNLYVMRQGPGDASPSSPLIMIDEANATVTVADASFGMDRAPDGSATWCIHCQEAGVSGVSQFDNTDDGTGAGWTRNP